MQYRGRIRLLPLLLLILLGIAFFVGMQGRGTDPQVTAQPVQAAVVSETPARAEEATKAVFSFVHSSQTPARAEEARSTATAQPKRGDREEVAAYLREHGRLPDYYITKQEASRLGWRGGSLEAYAPGRMIGGDRFGNYEGLLPKRAGRVWTECDIGSYGKAGRGAKRIVFSNDGLIFYTEDHYQSFVELKEAD